MENEHVLPPFLGDEPGRIIDSKAFVVMVANDNTTRIAVPRAALIRFSHIASLALEGSDTSEELPLGGDFCTPKAMQLATMWITHYADTSCVPPRIPTPLPADASLQSLLLEWDYKFFTRFVIPDIRKQTMLVALMNVCVFLDIKLLLDLCCAFLSWHLIDVAASASKGPPSASERVRAWFGKSGDFTPQEWKGIQEKFSWCRDITYEAISRSSNDANQDQAQSQ